ncbi:hypothetical protein D3C81_1891700 [compost metagenome]
MGADQLVAHRRIDQVAGKAYRLGVWHGGFQLGQRLLHAGAAAAVDDNACAGLGKPLGRGKADAGRGTRDEGGLAR